jgi:hypothetical protein
MKKILSFFLFSVIAVITANAQALSGFDNAFNFGGTGYSVDALTLTDNGDTYFAASLQGKSTFGGQSFTSPKKIFGKVSSVGTQTLLRVIEYDKKSVLINSSGELYLMTIGKDPSFYPAGFDYGNGILNNTAGYFMIKINNAGIAQWKKNVDTGSDILYGKTTFNSPTVFGMQFTPNGDLYMLINAGLGEARNTPNSSVKFSGRAIKFNGNGDQQWFKEIFTANYFSALERIDQFVSNDGRMTFSIIDGYGGGSVYFDGQSIFSEMSRYPGNLAGDITISLKPDGSKNFFIADTKGHTGLKSVNPINGDIYLDYGLFSTSYPGRAPFTSLPNQYSLSGTYLFQGTLTFNSAGLYKGYVLSAQANFSKLYSTQNGFIGLGSSIDKGDYTINGKGVLSYYDASFNFIKATETPLIDVLSINGDNIAVAGGFKGSITLGNITLVESPNQTISDYTKDLYIATLNSNNITPPIFTNWLGVDNNWNNAANWSLGIVPTDGTLVKFNANKTFMPTSGTTPKALKVIIDAGVIAQLPADLSISGGKLIINGKLQINHTGNLGFGNYGANAVEGTGTIEFKGTSTATVTTYSFYGYKDLTLETNDNINFSSFSDKPIFKKIVFTGTNSVLKSGFTSPIEITSPDEDAITGYGKGNYIEGVIIRAVKPTGTYVFPATSNKFGYGYDLATLKLNNLQGLTKVTATFKGDISSKAYKFPNGSSAVAILGNNDYGTSVTFTGDAEPTSGDYDVTFQKTTFNNGVLEADKEKYFLLTDGVFKGTKLASTQIGGTINGENVSNATVAAGISGLKKLAEFVIEINSAIVPVGTGLSAASWNGSVDANWNTAGNWDTNLVPNSLTDVTIPVVTTRYPSIYSNTDFVNSLTINSGVLDMKLSHLMATNLGITNNGDVKIAKVAGTSTIFSGSILGNGKLRFEADCGLTGIYTNTLNNVEFNIGNTNTVSVGGAFSGSVNIKSGKLIALSGTLYPQSPGTFQMLNPNLNPNIQIDASVDGISTESFVQSVNASGTYYFPLVSEITYQHTSRNYGGLTIKNNGVDAAKYTTRFSWLADPVSVLSGSTFYRNYVNSGVWFITPDKLSTTGTIDLTFKTSGFDASSARADVADYVLLRRATNSIYDNYVPWQIVTGAIITQSAGIITVTANGQPAISTGTTFCIGTKATITTWTGAKDKNWDDVANWNNGLPNPDFKAIIGNATNYPNNIPTNAFQGSVNNPAILEITSGSVVSMKGISPAKSGIINNGTIKVIGTERFEGFKYFNDVAQLSGTGKLVFDANSPATFYVGYINNSIDIDRDIAINYTPNAEIDITGNVNLISGKVTMNPSEKFTMSNPDATFTSSANASIMGAFKRKVNGTGSYNFPVGSTNANLTLNGLVGTTDISTSFSTTPVSGQPSLTISGQSVNSVLAGGSWMITPNVQPTVGTYSVSLSAPLGSSTANNYYVLKRPGNYGAWTNQGTNEASSVTEGIVTASVSGLTSFSQFGIGEGFGTLPVKLIKFLASAESKTAKLYWETASELNNDKFEVERSANGVDFSKIGEVEGNGTAQNLNKYTFKDFAPKNGVNYYRLKQVDFNGNFEYSEIKYINFKLKETTFSFFPNPASECVYFNATVKTLEVYNLQGTMILKRTIPSTSFMIPSEIQSGIYLIKAVLIDGSSVSRQLVISK